jgi:hypothetical protein
MVGFVFNFMGSNNMLIFEMTAVGGERRFEGGYNLEVE